MEKSDMIIHKSKENIEKSQLFQKTSEAFQAGYLAGMNNTKHYASHVLTASKPLIDSGIYNLIREYIIGVTYLDTMSLFDAEAYAKHYSEQNTTEEKPTLTPDDVLSAIREHKDETFDKLKEDERIQKFMKLVEKCADYADYMRKEGLDFLNKICYNIHEDEE